MESAITAFIVTFLMLFGALTLSRTSMEAQDRIHQARREMEVRLAEQVRTDLTPITATVQDGGSTVEVQLLNEGDTRLTDYPEWDVIVHCTDDTGLTQAVWLPFNDGVLPLDNGWVVHAVQMGQGTPEAFEPGILNPGEVLVLRMRLVPGGLSGTPGMVVIAAPNGARASVIFTF